MPQASYPKASDLISLYYSTSLVPDATAEPFTMTATATSISADAAIGATTISLNSVLGYLPGDTIFIGTGVSAEVTQIVSLSGLTATVLPLQTAHSANAHVVKSAVNWVSKARAASAEWETRTGWRPYLSSGVAEVRFFDPPGTGRTSGLRNYSGGKTLELNAGILSINSATGLSIGYTPPLAGGDGGIGTPLTQNLQYFMKPSNAIQRGQAWTNVEFLSSVRGVPESIRIEAIWGRVSKLPDDVWQTILGYGASLCRPSVSLAISHGLASWKEGDVEERYSAGKDAGPLSAEAGQWVSEFMRLAKFLKRVTL